MSNRTVSHDHGDHVEVVVYQDGVEQSRTIKPKKGVVRASEWEMALKANGNREPECAHNGGDVGVTLKVECSCSESGEKMAIVHKCNIASIRRCLPSFHPNKNDRKKWSERKPESDIYRLCDACEHFQAKEPTI